MQFCYYVTSEPTPQEESIIIKHFLLANQCSHNFKPTSVTRQFQCHPVALHVSPLAYDSLLKLGFWTSAFIDRASPLSTRHQSRRVPVHSGLKRENHFASTKNTNRV